MEKATTEDIIALKPVETTPKEPRKTINLSTGSFVRLMIQGGMAAVLAACSATAEAKKDIPQVALKDLISNPVPYFQLPVLKTCGYPEFVDEESVTNTIFTNSSTGTVPIFSHHTENIYRLHITPDLNSPYISLREPGLPANPNYPDHLSFETGDKYEVTGFVAQVKFGQDTNVDSYILNPAVSFTEVFQPTPDTTPP